MRYRPRHVHSIEAFPVKGCEITISKADGSFARAKDGDWIAKGINGELYPIENEYFMKLYEVDNA